MTSEPEMKDFILAGLQRILGENQRIEVVEPNEYFYKIHTACQGLYLSHQQVLLALDPGETTGVAVWDGLTRKIYLCQLETKDIGQSFELLTFLVQFMNPAHIRMENYKVYGYKSDDHKWNELHTSQWIGAIKACAYTNKVPYSLCMAQQAKKFWTDDKLEKCNLYQKGIHHARDAERHLLYYICFPTKVEKATPRP